MKYTIKELEKILPSITDENDPLIQLCLQDHRKGVQALIKKWQRERERKIAEQKRLEQMTVYEQNARKQGFSVIAGVDEAGRGPLAGPVVAAAVIMPEDTLITEVNDSKKLTQKKREELYSMITERAITHGIGIVGTDEIDRLNIYEATKKAMNIAVNGLSHVPDYLLIDAVELHTPFAGEVLVKGDAKSYSIACASIIAKVYRDRLMTEYGKRYPEYGFEKNMGYGTKEHILAIKKYGVTPIHRKSFSPVKEILDRYANITE